MDNFDYGGPLGGLWGFLSGLGGGAAPVSQAPAPYDMRDNWIAAQKAQNLPFDDKTYLKWLSANSPPTVQTAPEEQVVPLPGLLGRLFGDPNTPAASAVIPPPVGMTSTSASAADVPNIAQPPLPAPPMQAAMQPAAAMPMGNALGQFAPVAANALLAKGLSPAAAQGIMANGLGEGGFQYPWVKSSAPGENSFGHWQLNKNGELPNYLANEGKGNPQDTAAQAAFVARRMEEAVPGFSQIQDPAQATQLVLNKFEKPAKPVPRTGYLEKIQAAWPGIIGAMSPIGTAMAASPGQPAAPPSPQTLATMAASPMVSQGTPAGTINVPQNGPATFTGGPQLPGVGASGVAGQTNGLGLNVPANATPEQVLQAFLNSGSGYSQKFKLMQALQAHMPPQSNQAATLARMAAGFLGGKGGAASLAGGFGGMAEGLGQSNQTANQFQLHNLSSLQGALPDPNQETMQERLASQFMRSGMAPGDAFAAAGVQITPDRQQLLNSQSQAGKPLPSVYQKNVDSGIAELGSLRTSQASLMNLQDAVKNGELKLDPAHQLWYQAQAALGNPAADPSVTKYQQYVALQHTLQNDVLRQNKGIQTDKDASNAMAMIAGGGIKSSDQFLQHSDFLLNRMQLEEPNVKTRIGLAYQNAKQQMPSGLMDTIEQALPGVPPRATPKEIGSNIYGGNGRTQAAPQAPAATGLAPPTPAAPKVSNGLSPERQQQLRLKYGIQ